MALRVLVALISLGGAMLLGFSAREWGETREFVRDAKVAPGKVVELERSVDRTGPEELPVVEFKAGAETIRYREDASAERLGVEVGSSVEVLYDPWQPSLARLNRFASLWGRSAWMAGSGAMLTALGALGAASILARSRRTKWKAWLELHGKRVRAQVTCVKEDPQAARGSSGTVPVRLHCEWKDPETGRCHRFASEALAEPPRGARSGVMVEVIIDPQHPDFYWVDVGTLPRARAA